MSVSVSMHAMRDIWRDRAAKMPFLNFRNLPGIQRNSVLSRCRSSARVYIEADYHQLAAVARAQQAASRCTIAWDSDRGVEGERESAERVVAGKRARERGGGEEIGQWGRPIFRPVMHNGTMM